MRILVEPSDYVIRNFGDTAMLEAGLVRLSDLFPNSTIHVFSDNPNDFPVFGKNIHPISTNGRRQWFDYGLSALLNRSDNGILTKILRKIDSFTAWHLPFIHLYLVKLVLRYKGKDRDSIMEFYSLVRESNYLVVTGMGGITDSFSRYALELMSVAHLSQKMGNEVALFGQGIGPLSNTLLYNRARSVFKKAIVIGLRESKFAMPILKSMGVKKEAILSTGDDAIELAYKKRDLSSRQYLGINIRAAAYSGIQIENLETLKNAVQKVASDNETQLVALPISRVPGERDMTTIKKIIEGSGRKKSFDREIVTRDDLLNRVNLCRLVVTGSYHGGVFALSMGVPVVCIVSSDYYYNKFHGLKDQFSVGIEVVQFGQNNWAEMFEKSVSNLWQRSDDLRDDLLHDAKKQIDHSIDAYSQFSNTVKTSTDK